MRLIDEDGLIYFFRELYNGNDIHVQKQRGCMWLSLESLEQFIHEQPTAHDPECIPIHWITTHSRFPKNEERARVLNDMIESWYAEEWGEYWGD